MGVELCIMMDHRATIRRAFMGGDFLRGQCSREHEWSLSSGVRVPVLPSPSVVPLPYSKTENVDPEEAFVAAISSCHMLTFLYVASKAGVQLERYVDESVGVMTRNEKGVYWVSSVTLDPNIVYAGEQRPSAEGIEQLFRLAHEQRFIAASVRMEVVVASS